MGRRDGLLERKQRVVLLVVFQTAASAFVMEGAGHFGWSCGVAANVSDQAVFTSSRSEENRQNRGELRSIRLLASADEISSASTRNGLIICLCAGRNVVPDWPARQVWPPFVD